MEFKFCLCRVIKGNFCVGVLVKNLPSIFLYCIGRKKPGMKFLVLLVGDVYSISQYLYHTGDKRELFAWIYGYIATIPFPIFHFINFFLATVSLDWINSRGRSRNRSQYQHSELYLLLILVILELKPFILVIIIHGSIIIRYFFFH